MEDALLETTISLAGRFGVSPFDILREDMDEVISFVNYYIHAGPRIDRAQKAGAQARAGEERVRVNDRTATGGWF